MPEPYDQDQEDEWNALEIEYAKRFPRNPGIIDLGSNKALLALLALLVGTLIGLMFWILFGVAIMRWVL